VVAVEDLFPGAIRFALAPTEQLTGFTTAQLFPIEDGRIAVEKWIDVVATQVKERLILAKWLARRQPGGPYALQYACLISGPRGTEYRVGWARFDSGQLKASGIDIRPREGSRVRLSVLSQEGQGIPGAMVALAPDPFRPGMLSWLLYTGEEGLLTISGLPADSDQTWTASVPDGIGPDDAVATESITADSAEVSIVTHISGNWSFCRSSVRMPLPGASFMIQSAKGTRSGLPSVWPVARWIGPGRGPDAPLYFMFRPPTARSSFDPALVLKIKHYEDVLIPDATQPVDVLFTPNATTVTVAPR
jgi:hypothetical protein